MTKTKVRIILSLFILGLFAVTLYSCKKDTDIQLSIHGIVRDVQQNINVSGATLKLSRQVLSNGTFNSGHESIGTVQSSSNGSYLFEFDRVNVVEYKLEAQKSNYISETIIINPDLVKPNEVYAQLIELIPLATINVRIQNTDPFDEEDQVNYQNMNTNFNCNCCDNTIVTINGENVDTTLTCKLYGDSWLRYLYSITKNGNVDTVVDSVYCNALETTSIEINY